MTASKRSPASFTFGSPEPVLGIRGLIDHLECWINGKFYSPPLPIDALARITKSSVHLDSGLKFKRNMLLKTFVPHRLLSRETFDQFVLDFLWSGNAYLEQRRNMMGNTLELRPTLAKYMRRGVNAGEYFQVNGWGEPYEFEKNSIIHIRETDINQDIYGLPEWLSAMQSALLNESATLFRRRYYENGSHAGFILYMNDPAHNEDDIKALRESLKSAKGPGNFRNLFMYSPGGKKDGLQVIPVSEVAAKDEFINIKNLSRDDVLASLRIPPQLMGIVPANPGGFGSIKDASETWEANELAPIQGRLRIVNEIFGTEVIKFVPL